MSFEPGVGGRFVERSPNGEVFEVGKIHAWEPGSRLTFDWRLRNFRPDETTEVEITFEKISDGTRVTIEHRGWDTLPAAHPARHGLKGQALIDILGLNWADLLTAFRSYSSRRKL